MNLKGEITEKAMRQGVKDSEAFIVFLTNSYLSRSYCLKELGWAIEFKTDFDCCRKRGSILVLGHRTLAHESMYEGFE